jgi:hypothetical protein
MMKSAEDEMALPSTPPNRTSRRVRPDENQSNPEQCGKLEFPRSGEKKCERENKMFSCTSVDDGTFAFGWMDEICHNPTLNDTVIALLRHKVTKKLLQNLSAWPGSVLIIFCKGVQ